jgi:hypothetical protein
MKRSAELVTDPVGVFKEIRPEPVVDGVFMDMDVDAADVGFKLLVTFTISRSLTGVESKFAPVIVTAVPGNAICGVNESMRGFPSELVTVNESAVVIEPEGEEIARGPDVAPRGTETTRVVEVAEMMVAAVPLKVTESWAGLELKFEPEIATFVPTGPDFGVNVKNANWPDEYLVIDVIFPTGSYAYLTESPVAATAPISRPSSS